jgi:hypothetical protein
MGASGERAYSGGDGKSASSSQKSGRRQHGDRNNRPAEVLFSLELYRTTAMPRYYFHVREGQEISRDTEGQDLPNADAARTEAINASREILGEKLLHGGSLNHRQIEIADETGHVVDVVNSSDVLFKGGQFRSYSEDVTQSAPVNTPRK